MLYRRVLDEVMTQWLAGMGELAAGDDPAAALRPYIGAKMRSSRERPDSSHVFTKEGMAGAPRYGDAIAERVQKLNFTHLMFMIWAVTQAYADLAPQFALLLGKPALDERDFAAAQALLERLVMGGLRRAAA